MRTRLLGFVLGLLAIPSVALADSHRWDGFIAGGGGNGASSLFSFHQTASIFPFYGRKDSILTNVSLVADWATQFGKHDDGTRVTQFPLSFGGRYTQPLGSEHFQPYAQVLGSWIYTNDGAADATDGALVVGFGLDWVKTPHGVSTGYGLRLAVDYFDRNSARENFWRVSGGVVFRFGQN
jgi:hypothetical protein